MRVLHVTPSVGPVRGGPSQAVLELVKALQEMGVEAEIVTTNDNGSKLLDVPLYQLSEYNQAPVRFFPRFSPPIAPVREFAFSRQLTTWLWQHIAEYDLIHVHALFSYTSTVTMAISRLKRLPYIVCPHGLLCTWSLQQSALKKQIYLAFVEKANLNSAQALQFTLLKEQQEATPLHLRTASFVLPFGLFVPKVIQNARHRLRQHLQVPEDELVILFMSRIHYKKGLDYLIPALGKVANQRFTFVLAGSGSPDYEAEIDALLLAAGIRDRTHRPGFVIGETKDLLLQGADLFVLTSHSENFGVAVLEAMAVGLPVLVTPGVALAEIVEQSHLGYVVQMSVEAIAATLESFFSHPQKARAMGDRARQLIQDRYIWGQIATKMIQVYECVMNKKTLPSSY